MKGFPGRAEDEKDRKLQLFIESQFVLEKDTNVLVMSYSDIFIQVGYVMLFAQAFPLAPVFSIIVNLIEQKSTIDMLSNYSQRFEALPAKNIGSWLAIGEVYFILLTFLDFVSDVSCSELCDCFLQFNFFAIYLSWLSKLSSISIHAHCDDRTYYHCVQILNFSIDKR